MTSLGHMILEALFIGVAINRRRSAGGADVGDQAGHVVLGVFQFPDHQIICLDVAHLAQVGAEPGNGVITANDGAGPAGPDIEGQAGPAAAQIGDVADHEIAFPHLTGLYQQGLFVLSGRGNQRQSQHQQSKPSLHTKFLRTTFLYCKRVPPEAAGMLSRHHFTGATH